MHLSLFLFSRTIFYTVYCLFRVPRLIIQRDFPGKIIIHSIIVLLGEIERILNITKGTPVNLHTSCSEVCDIVIADFPHLGSHIKHIQVQQ